MSVNSYILNTFHVVACYTTCYTLNSSLAELDRSIKRKPIEIKENTVKLSEIDALWLSLHSYFADHIWCPINSLECQSVDLWFTASIATGKQSVKQNNTVQYDNNFIELYIS